MTANFWRGAAACLIALVLLFGLGQCAFAAEASCRKLEDEAKLALVWKWKESARIEGERAAMFIQRYNDEPPSTSVKADTVVFFKKEGASKTGLLFVAKGCIVKMDMLSPMLLDKLRGGMAI